jgi:DNA polymerase-1
MSKVMLIDGNSLTYRAFFALPTDLATASGQVTNAVYGFTSMLVNLVRDHRPDLIAVAMDRPEPTFRHEAVQTYKANRDEAPDILRQQMGLVREVIEVLQIPVVELPGFEADDVIATLATEGRDRGDEVLIVTGDRDAYQLVEDPLVRVLYNKRGVSDYALYDEAGILERTGVTPDRYVAYAALRGDPSDNLPGVAGVGEKTAAKLVNAYGDIDGIYAHVDDQTPKLRENLAANEDQVRINVQLMPLIRDLDLEVGLDDFAVPDYDTDAVHKLFDFLEFHSLYERLGEAFGSGLLGGDGATADAAPVVEAEMTTIETTGEARSLLARERASDGRLAVAGGWVGEPARSAFAGMAFVTDVDGAEVAWLPATLLDDEAVIDELVALLGASGRPLVAHGAKELMVTLLRRGVDVRELALDTLLAAYLLDPAESRYALDELLLRYARVELPDGTAAPDGQLDLDGDAVDGAQDSARRALAVSLLGEPLEAALEAQGLADLNRDIEVPLVRLLAKMEEVGIGVDVAELEGLAERLIQECDALRAQIWEDAGEEFNVNSTPQLREVLFERLGLTPQKKTKTGFSTDAASLEKLRGDHPIIEHLLRYREVEKLRSTYGEGLLAEVGPDGRIHASFNQTVARTGRLSSDRPNLHNIPVRTEEGRRFRKAFVPAAGFGFLVADYNQIELRCIAHLAEDPGLIAAFESGTDIHTETAARIFSADPDSITTEQRSKAKMVSYGLAYGMEAFGPAQRLNIPTSEASDTLDAYFEAFPAVQDYMDRTVAEARERGYTETLFGRRRQIPELSSGNYRIRQAGERQAMNAGIQGLAADIFKVALVRLDRVLDEGDFESRVVLQVHDEVIVEVADDERDVVSERTVDSMSGAFELRVPLEVNVAFGSSWADAKH